MCYETPTNMSEPYTNDSTYWRDTEVKFENSLGSNGIYVTVYGITDPTERQDFTKHLKRERDVVTIKFK